jgi:hypothetical protein
LSYNDRSHEAVIASAWGPDADWIRNLKARPASEVRIGRDCFVPEHRFLTYDEARAVALDFQRRHRWRLRLMATILGWGELNSDSALLLFVHEHPFVSLRPAR